MFLVIQSLGAFTSVGGDVPMTMASLLSQFQAFDDLDAERGVDAPDDGAVITGAATPLPARLTGVGRLAALGMLSLQECAAASPPGPPVPLFVCAPDRHEWEGSPSELLDGVTGDASIGVDLGQSRVFSNGRTGVIDAILAGRELLETRRAPAFYLLGVDSLVTGERPFRLMSEGRLLYDENSDGFVPGEGAAALRVSAAGSEGLAALAGLGTGEEPAGGVNGTLTGVGLNDATTAAVTEAKLRGSDLHAVVHDVSGVQRDFEDFMLARGRSPLDAATAARIFAPSISVGEIGAAAGPLAIAMLAFFIHKGVVGGPGVCLFRSNGSGRGAVVVAPLPSTRRGNHG
jgi:3-oxoacyl-[acyl-carrier-protein] synthase-1